MIRLLPRRSAGLAAVLLAASGCAGRATTGAAARASSAVADSAAILAAAREFSAAYVRGDAAAMAQLYTADAAIFPDLSPVIVGRGPIRDYWTVPPNRRITRHVLMSDRVEILGDVAHDYGRFEVSGETDGVAWGPSSGKYVVVWRRGDDGRWRMYLDIWNRGPRAGG